MKSVIYILIGVFFINCSFSAQIKWTLNSSELDNPVPILLFKPDTYTSKKPYPLVYMLHGYSEDYSQWSKTINCQDLSNKYNMIIVCPEGFTSYYINSPDYKGSQYESFFFKTLIPKIHKEFSIDRKNIFITGLSMGGYGALRYFILHPDYFNTAGSTSGAINIEYTLFKEASLKFWNSTRMTDDLQKLIKDKDIWEKYSIINLIKENNFIRPFIFDCGTNDIFYESSLQLNNYVKKEDIPVTFISPPGEHTTNYWNKSIEYHFLYFQQHLK